MRKLLDSDGNLIKMIPGKGVISNYEIYAQYENHAFSIKVRKL